MNRARRGFALPAAIAAVIVLSGLAALASIAARVALREAAALAAEAQSSATRVALQARAAVALSRLPREQLVASPRLVAERDTAIVTIPLAWPWHRVGVLVGSTQIVAEVARATAPSLPWCAAAVTGGSMSIAPGAIALDPGSLCTELSHTDAPAAIGAFVDSLAADLILSAEPDTLVVSLATPPGIFRARSSIQIASGASVTGVIVAPSVIVFAGASVRGIVVANASLRIDVGGAVMGDEHAATAALRGASRLHLLGRAGLLSPP